MDRPEARRRISEYWIKKRCRGKTVLEVLKEIRLESEQELAFFLYALLDDEHCLDFAVLCELQLWDIRREIQILIAPVEQKYVRFFNTPEADCPIFYRFRLPELPRLMQLLQFPADVQLPNGRWVDGQTALLIGLHRYAFAIPLVAMEERFGLELVGGSQKSV